MAPPLLDPSSPLRALQRQVRLVRKKLTVLLPKNDYYVQAECMAALGALGHRVVEVSLGAAGEVGDVGACLGLLLRACVAHRPDMLLTINYTGFDRAAWFDELVEAMGLPVAVWFVDSPFFLAIGYLPPAPQVTSFFCWDKSYVSVLRAHGAPRVFHLPLATDPNVFRPAQPVHAPRWPMGFVGHTMDALVQLWGQRDLASADAPPAGQVHDTATCWAELLLGDRAALHTLVPAYGPPCDPHVARLAHANYLASRTLRCKLLRPLPQRALHLFGNVAWREHLPQAHHHAGMPYGAQTAQVYQACAVNLNVTNLQMPCTVNQRVFDVPAAGAFLLTDAQPELEVYFDLDSEVATYGDGDELREKAVYYARAPRQRAKVVDGARRRVLAEHTYVHRMEQLIATMRAHHGPGTRGS